MRKETFIQKIIRKLIDIRAWITTGKSNKQREKEMNEGWSL